MNSNFIITLPATCELCGNWLPGHSSACPRNGVHPSQWKKFDIIMNKTFGKLSHDKDDCFQRININENYFQSKDNILY
ncbi:uncharacterized protein BX663DRAFT_491190 [Cokeromyces recurvatus]|uniref:uncharacterized protein n=1 Tax=Cokeromyces recurvatus TaxID=90255 RepID=UPI00221FD60A|nr:uncharacterized protein BX663DRAFT_491190 [Cokeromyces recurvatus]KAI7907530.1 hypothetical protein BX663DRAFT_491190 [Cokeromyces recurvatus]